MASWANISCIFYLEKRFAQFCEEIPEVWWRLLTTSAPLCFIRMYLWCFYVFNTEYIFIEPCETHTCILSLQSDYHFEYTECDVLGARWRVAVPNKAEICTGLPDPVQGTQCSESSSPTSHFTHVIFYHLCSLLCCPHRRDTHHHALRSLLFLVLTAFSCNEGEFLDMQSQQCRKCAAGTYSLGTGIAFDEWDRLPSGFVTHGVNTNGEDVQTDCSKSVYVSELRWSIKVLAVLQLSLLPSLQLNLGPKRWLHSLKHRRVHRNTVLRREPEETWNCVLWIFLPREQHLLRVLRKCFKNYAFSLTHKFLEVTHGNFRLFVQVQNDQCQSTDTENRLMKSSESNWSNYKVGKSAASLHLKIHWHCHLALISQRIQTSPTLFISTHFISLSLFLTLTVQLDLNTGNNVLYWRTTTYAMQGSAVKPVMLRNIAISGRFIAFV